MTSSEVRKKYLDFFQKKGHKVVPSASLVPENDPTTLFTSAGMQPMIPYLLGEPHPEGKKIVDSQKSFRAQDIEEVGDNRHTTFFEMLGNWSFGDYFKKEQLEWFFEFLTSELGLEPNRLYVTAFGGDTLYQLPRDEETVQIWQELFKNKNISAEIEEFKDTKEAYEKGLSATRILYFGDSINWWSRSGSPDQMPQGEPGGPDSEVFYEFPEIEHNPRFGKNCHPHCDCGRFLEIGNSVFMQYQKTEDGFKELPQKNVDFGGGLERLVAATNNQPDIFKNDLHWGVIEKVLEETGVNYEDQAMALRVIADHIKAATFLIKDGVAPGNKMQGYVLRRLLRRSAVKLHLLKPDSLELLPKLVDPVLDIYSDTDYFQTGDWDNIRGTVEQEVKKFEQTLARGLKEIEKIEKIDGKIAFDLYQSYGFPFELLEELFKERGQTISKAEFDAEFEKHQQLSKQGSEELFQK